VDTNLKLEMLEKIALIVSNNLKLHKKFMYINTIPKINVNQKQILTITYNFLSQRLILQNVFLGRLMKRI